MDAGSALTNAVCIARQIAANGPLAVTASLRVLREAQKWPTEAMFELQRAITDPIFASDDAREGPLAFVERRKPVWRGR